MRRSTSPSGPFAEIVVAGAGASSYSDTSAVDGVSLYPVGPAAPDPQWSSVLGVPVVHSTIFGPQRQYRCSDPAPETLVVRVVVVVTTGGCVAHAMATAVVPIANQ